MTSVQVRRVVTLAAAYWGAAWLFGLLALPPGFSAPIWPAAGIALGALYAWGPVAWPGVLAGSLAFNLGLSVSASATSGIGGSVIAALIIATGATLQAIGGGLLLRRLIGQASALEDPIDVLRLLVAGGPVSCLINASWSVGLLVALGFLPADQWAINWLVWWAGDMTGVMIFAPLFLIFVGTPQDAWKRRRITVAIPLVLCLGVLLLLFAGLRRWESEQLRVELSRHADEAAQDLQRALETQLAINRSVANLYEAYPESDRMVSQRYLDTVYRGLGGPRAISWVPRVAREERNAHEEKARRDGLRDYAIREASADGTMTLAGDRREYFPVHVISPDEENRPALGYDIGSEKVRAEAIAWARSTGKPVMTGPLRLVQWPGEATGLLLLTPVFDFRASPGKRERQPDALLGFISTVMAVSDVVESALGGEADSAAHWLVLHDRGRDGQKSLIYAGSRLAQGETVDGERGHVAHVRAGGRSWEVAFTPAPLSGIDKAGGVWWYRYALLTGGAIVVSLLGALLLIFTARARHLRVIENTVRDVARGNYRVRIPIAPGSPLAEVESGINEMIGKIHVSRDELESRIHEATAELEQRRAEAEAATLAKSRVIAYASHDLRQPLHALQLFISHLRQESVAPETSQLVRNIDESAQALVALLDGLLDLSRLEAGLVRASPRAVPVFELWDLLHASFAPVAAAKNLELRLRHSDLCLATDPQLMQRILLNLVSNAIRYTDKGGVLVACRRAGGHARLQVWDTGTGIPLDRQGEVFKEFVQLDNAERGREKGLGLGLSIVERTARLLGHRLSLRSVPGRGTCFSVDVPLADGTQFLPEHAESPAPADDVDFTKCAIMVVEDDALARRALVDLLRSWGCVVTEAANAEAAQRALAEGCRPDVIASDVRLPNGQDGITFVREFRGRVGRDVAAFLISGDTDAKVMAAANAAGLPLLHKPVKAARLRTVLHLLLKGARDAAG